MMNQDQDNFNLYLANFKNNDLKTKQKIVFDKMKELAVVTNSFCKEIGASNEIIINKELSDLLNANYTEDDFAEAMLVLAVSIQESVCDFHAKLADSLAKMNN
jgi:hypothetical protein